MFDALFLQVLNMSFNAGIVIIIVLFLRLLLKQTPKVYSYALWSVVLFRLISPFSFESIFSLFPAKANPISREIAYFTVPTVDTGITTFNNVVNASLPAATPYASVNPLQIWISIGSILWLMGISILLIYSIISYIKLKRQLKNAMHHEDNIYLVDDLKTPFVMGFIHPRIYMPLALSNKEQQLIILHEQTHIRRFDPMIKMFSFFVLCVHWFNPLVWIAFFSSIKDMEMSCDEAVIKLLGYNVKKDYSSSLLSLSSDRYIMGGIPLAFSEGDTKDRIKNILKYKSPTFWGLLITTLVIIIIGLGLIANPINHIDLLDVDSIYLSEDHLSRVNTWSMITNGQKSTFGASTVPDFVEFIETLQVHKSEVSKSRSGDRDTSNRIEMIFNGFYDESPMSFYFNFNSDYTEIWVDNDIKPSFSYKISNPSAVKSFFDKHLDNTSHSVKVVSANELWHARIPYVGNNSGVSKLLNLMPIPSSLSHNSMQLYTNGDERGLEWLLDGAQNMSYDEAEIQQIAVLLFALIDNLEDFYVTITSPSGEITKLQYHITWADQLLETDVKSYDQSVDKIQALMNLSAHKTSNLK
jgi:beta-lactamase regulating signal transducer with metallopeptidase domain